MTKISKDQVLADVGTLVGRGKLTLDELQKVYDYNVPESAKRAVPVKPAGAVQRYALNSQPHTGVTISNVLYVVGTLIVCLGIFLLISQNWSLLNTPIRIIVTSGLGLAVLVLAWYRARRQANMNHDLLTGSLFTIGSVATTIGVGVIITEAGANLSAPGTVLVAALALSAAFLAAYLFVLRTVVWLTFAVALSVLAYYAGFEWLTRDVEGPDAILYFETAFVGALLVTGGIMMRSRAIASQLSGLLYGVGALMTLSSLFFLTITSGYSSGDVGAGKLTYDILYPLILAGGVALSVYVRSRDILVLTAIFLTGYIFEISAEYFSGFLGGSVALCLAGVLVMGMAYGATRFAKRYITK
jgi:hypothetical protein